LIAYVGSYDFGGLAACRVIRDTNRRGISGILFAFVIRHRITRDDGDECLFRFEPVFVTEKGEIDEEAAVQAAAAEAENLHTNPQSLHVAAAFAKARSHLETKAQLWDWDDDVEFLGLSYVEFV
ncbi:MAG: hypothetical protein ACREEE_07975, partial [Dongiaceae bacterium]